MTEDRSLVVLSVSGTERKSLRTHVVLGAAVVFGIGYFVGRRRAAASSTSTSTPPTRKTRSRRFTALDGKR